MERARAFNGASLMPHTKQRAEFASLEKKKSKNALCTPICVRAQRAQNASHIHIAHN